MDYIPYIELLLFAAFMVGTPGPANLVIMAAGARYGLRRCMWFLMGLLLGKMLVNLMVGAGFGLVFDRYPIAVQMLKFLSAGVMIWLVLQTLRKSAGSNEAGLTLTKGAIVHLVNPKAYAMSILAWSNFAPHIEGYGTRFAAVVFSFMLMQVIFHTSWGFAGQLLHHAMGKVKYLQEILAALTVLVVLLSLLA